MYPDVYEWLGVLMPDFLTGVTSGYDIVIRAETRDALAPVGLSFDTLSEADQDRVNEAVALRVAARIVSGVTTGGAGGALTMDDNGESKRQFSGDQASEWLAKASAILNRTSLGGVQGDSGPVVVDAYPYGLPTHYCGRYGYRSPY
jgi:hypothetical protein